MWDLLKQVFDGETHPRRRLAMALALIAIAAFAVWKSFPESIRGDLLRKALTPKEVPRVVSPMDVARDSANALESRLSAVSRGVQVQYYAKASDARIAGILIPLLQQRGFQVATVSSPRDEPSNAIWCGSDVSVPECVLVALRMMQSGFGVIQLFRYPPGRDRPAIIQIGHNSNLDRLEPYSVARLMVLVHTGIPADRTPR